MADITYPIVYQGEQVYTLTKPKPTGNAPDSVGAGGGRLDADLARGFPYEYKFLREIESLHLEGLAIDVGAHVGNHTLWMATVCGLAVEAFEPDPTSYTYLSMNVWKNDLAERVNTHQRGLGAPGVYRGGWDSEVPGLINPMEATGTILMNPLDHYEFEGVSLIKIDVEGSEPAVLAGAEKTLRLNRPVVYAEARTKASRARIGAVLEPMGYTLDHLVLVSSPLGCWRHNAN